MRVSGSLGLAGSPAPGVHPDPRGPPPNRRGWRVSVGGLKEDQFKTLRAAFPGIDIQEMEKQFVAWNAEKGVTPENYVSALYGFIKQKVKWEG